MSRRKPARKGFTYRDPATAARLDAIGIPGDVTVALAALKVSLNVVERLHASGVDWGYVRSLAPTHALTCGDDVAALATFMNMGMNTKQIDAWARLGPLDAALRLHLKNVPVATATAFPLTPEHSLGSLLRMLQTITNTGIHVDDVLLWHTAGVVSLTPPFLIERLWAPWRSVAVQHLGMRSAALAAAAGLSVEEATTQWVRGDFNADTLKMMAALRAGRF